MPEFGVEDLAAEGTLGKVRHIDYLNTYEFLVDFPDVPGAGDLRLLVLRATVPGWSFNVEQREEGNRRIGYAMEENIENLSVEFVESINSEAMAVLQGWRNRIRSRPNSPNEDLANGRRFRNTPGRYKAKTVIVTHLDRTLRPVRRVLCKGVFPTALSSYVLDYTDNNLLVLSVQFSVDIVEPQPVDTDDQVGRERETQIAARPERWTESRERRFESRF